MSVRNKSWLMMLAVIACILMLNPVLASGPEDTMNSDLSNNDETTDVMEYAEGEVLVGFRPGANAKAVGQIRRALGASAKKDFSQIRVRLWTLPKGFSVEKAIQILMKNPLVEYAEPNYILKAHMQPDDPHMNELWAMHNIGQTGGLFDADIDAVEAWGVEGSTNASEIVVGIIDTGIDYMHEDLADNIWVNERELAGVGGEDDDNNGFVDDIYGWDFYNDDNDPFDDAGHGTHVAGTIGGVGDNGVGVAGVVWSVKLMALKFLSSAGSGETDDAIDAVLYAAMMGVPITNNSWGGGDRSKALVTAIAASNSLFVASAGNWNTSKTQFPAGYSLDNILSVAATDENDEKASYSNYGSKWVDLAAPGSGILSSLPTNTYGTKSGTSMAAPHVTGVAAMVMAQYPGLSPTEVKALIMDTVDLLPALDAITVSGGRLNAFKAVSSGEEPPPGDDLTPPGAVNDLAYVPASATYDAIELQWTATADDGFDSVSGPAYHYDLRYRTDDEITEANWITATQVDGEPSPRSLGEAESMLVTGLAGGTEYYFGLKILDESGNASELSNNVIESTLASPWLTGVVDDSGRVGFYQSMALVPGTDFPAIAYSDEATGKVKYAEWTGSSWNTVVIGSGGPGVSLAFDPSGNPAISYGWGKLYFAQRIDGDWNIKVIERNGAYNDVTSLAFDLDGKPCIAYQGTADKATSLKIACYDGFEWDVQAVQVGAAAKYKSLAFDLSGNAVIAYSDDLDGDNRIDALKLAQWNDSYWDIETISEGLVGTGVFASLVVDPESGSLMVVDKVNGNVRFFHRDDDEGWLGEIVGDVSESNSDANMTIDSTGLPYISYSTYSPPMLKIARPVTAGVFDNWEILVADNVDVRWRTSIVIKSDGLPIVSYGEGTNYSLKWVERLFP